MSTEQTNTTQVKNIYQRVLAVMEDVPYVQKVQRKTGLQYTFVNRDAVVSKLRVAMMKHGIVYYPTMINWSVDGNKTTMEIMNHYVNADNPAEVIEFPTLGYGIDSQDKGPGKAMTYAEKVAHLKQFMIEAGDEDECEHYEEPHKPEQPTKKPREISPDAKRAESKTATLEELKARYLSTQKKYNVSAPDFEASFYAAVPEKRRQDAKAIETFLNNMDARYSAWMEVLNAIKKWSVSGDMFDAAVAKVVGADATVTEKNWFTYTAEVLNKLADQVHADNDLPFDGEGNAIPK